MLHNLCFSFLVGITAVPREIENNPYALSLWGKQGPFWEMCKWRNIVFDGTHHLLFKMAALLFPA